MGARVSAEVAELRTKVVALEETVMSLRRHDVPSRIIESDSGHDDDFHVGFTNHSEPTEMGKVNASIEAFINAIIGEDEMDEKEEKNLVVEDEQVVEKEKEEVEKEEEIVQGSIEVEEDKVVADEETEEEKMVEDEPNVEEKQKVVEEKSSIRWLRRGRGRRW